MRVAFLLLSVSLMHTASLPRVAAQDEQRTALEEWFDKALSDEPGGEVGRLVTLPNVDAFDRHLNRDEVEAATKAARDAYAASARRMGWHERLLPTPLTFSELSKLPEDQRAIKASSLTSSDGLEMPYVLLAKGTKPKDGWPLFISMHGGGKYFGEEPLQGPHDWKVNSGEWQAQMKLSQHVYQPAGLYFLPRMADDRKGRWFHKHNIELFDRMIRLAILFNDVDPNRIYIMGISQGGYGTCHLGPFMADRFAAAGPMAGGMMTVVENLRNLPLRSDIGEHDTAYDRIKLAHQLHNAIDALRSEDPNGYENELAIQKGRGHGIDYSLGPNWLARHTRKTYPDRVVWRCHAKDGVYRKNFYWLSLTEVPEVGEFEITAAIDKKTNTITINAEEVLPLGSVEGEGSDRKPLVSSTIIVRLSDQLIDLDKSVTISINGNQVFQGEVKRKLSNIMMNIVDRGDINYAFPAALLLHPK